MFYGRMEPIEWPSEKENEANEENEDDTSLLPIRKLRKNDGMITIRPHEKLIVWQEAFRLSLTIYKQTTPFPQEERYCLVQQMRRSALSIPLNIAEGNSRRSKKEKRHFLHIALGSLEELHCQCRIARNLDYIDQTKFIAIDDHINRVSYLLNKLQLSFHPSRLS